MFLVSYEFVLFFAAVLVLYYGVAGRFQWIVLLLSSYLFYAQGGIGYLFYPVFTTVTTWFLAGAIGSMSRKSKAWIKENNPGREEKKEHNRLVKRSQRRIMVLGLVLNFGILAVLKYFNFLLENVNIFLHGAGAEGEFVFVNWLLPLGISYYTFQSMGYLIDVYYRKYEPEKNLARFALFVSFFPQLVAGPISRFEQLKDSLYVNHRLQLRNIRLGAERMLWGYFKKLVIADRLGPAVSVIIGDPQTYDGIYVFLGMVGYTLWMYADFAGGIDIVLGAARMLDISLPENFDRPFLSKSLGEFWRRWHMTLMLWLREYIFFPVSTSRLAKSGSKLAGIVSGKKAAGRIPVYMATLTVWFAAGIWHGASWKFAAWGMMNGAVLLISQELTPWYRNFHDAHGFVKTRMYSWFQIVRTFLLFACLEMFEYYSFGRVFFMLRSLVCSSSLSQLGDGRFEALGLKGADLLVLGAGIFAMAGSGFFKDQKSAGEWMEKRPVFARYGLIFGMFLLVLVTGVYGRGYDASQFIYNQF